jgi:hypothetical protein
VSEIDFEDIIVDPDGNVVKPPGPKTLGTLVSIFAVAFGPAARSELRTVGTERYAATGPDFQVAEERYTVAGVDDLGAVDIGLDGQSHAAVQQALARHLAANPSARGTLQVVPAFATAESE